MVGKVIIRVKMTPKLIKTLKKYAIDHDMTQEDAGGKIIEIFLKERSWKK